MGSNSIYSAVAAGWDKISSQPGLTWFSAAGERIELSAKVLDNWVIKTANLLFSEFDLGSGDTLGLHAPVHWRSMVFALAAWQRGAQVQFFPDDPPQADELPDVLVSSQISKLSSHHVNHTELIALHCASLSRQYPEDLPPLTLDANASTMTYPDQLLDSPVIDAAEVAVGSPALSHAEFKAQSAAAGFAPASRILVAQPNLQLYAALQIACGAWQVGSALVLLDPEVSWDAPAIQQIASSEQAELFEVQ